MSESTPPPLSPVHPPENPKWHAFALLVLDGKYLADAYQLAGFKCSRATAYVNGCKLARKPPVAAFMKYRRALEYAERQRATQERMKMSGKATPFTLFK